MKEKVRKIKDYCHLKGYTYYDDLGTEKGISINSGYLDYNDLTKLMNFLYPLEFAVKVIIETGTLHFIIYNVV